MRVGHFLKAPDAIPAEDTLAAYPPAVIFDLWHSRSASRKSHPFVVAIVRKYALEIALEESDSIIRDKDLKIKIKDLTTEEIRHLLQPERLKSRLRERAPFVWSLLHLFCSAPNEYRKGLARRTRARGAASDDSLTSSDVEMSDSTSSPFPRSAMPPDDAEFFELGQSLDDDQDASDEDDWADDPLADMENRDSDEPRDELKGFARSPVLVSSVTCDDLQMHTDLYLGSTCLHLNPRLHAQQGDEPPALAPWDLLQDLGYEHPRDSRLK